MMVNVGQRPADGKRKVTAHPSTENLVGYRSGELTPDEEQGISEHLACCSEAAEEMLDLERFEDERPQSEEVRLSDDEMAVDFDLLVTQLPKDNVIRFQKRPFLAVAAMVALGFGVSVWLAIGRAGDLSQPILNPDLIDLFPVSEVDRDSAADRATDLPNERFFLILHLTDTREYSSYEVVISDWEQTQIIWSTDGLERRDNGIFTMILPKQFISSGWYRMTLFGIENGKRVELSTYSTSFK